MYIQTFSQNVFFVRKNTGASNFVFSHIFLVLRMTGVVSFSNMLSALNFPLLKNKDLHFHLKILHWLWVRLCITVSLASLSVTY